MEKTSTKTASKPIVEEPRVEREPAPKKRAKKSAPLASFRIDGSDANDGSGLSAGTRRALFLNDEEIAAFRYCPPGTFMMGQVVKEGRSERIDPDEIRFKATLTQGFWILETAVSQRFWAAAMGKLPSFVASLVYPDDYPIVYVSWKDCQKFTARLNELAFAPKGWRFSLPTEAQWEYAARAGTNSTYPWGDVLNGDKANCDGSYPYGTCRKGPFRRGLAPVKSYEPNPWGLYCVCGNVLEWVLDGYRPYPLGSAVDPYFEGNERSARIARGGCWQSMAGRCRCSDRVITHSGKDLDFGLRLALVRDKSGFITRR